jgi:hypothetical protein
MAYDRETPPWETGAPASDLDGPCILVFRPHGALKCEVQFYGPFADFDAAYEAMDLLPALGVDTNPDRVSGEKWIAGLKALP